MIKKCDCVHKGQDSTNGVGLRTHNVAKYKTGRDMCRCTVCHKLTPLKKVEDVVAKKVDKAVLADAAVAS